MQNKGFSESSSLYFDSFRIAFVVYRNSKAAPSSTPVPYPVRSFPCTSAWSRYGTCMEEIQTGHEAKKRM